MLRNFYGWREEPETCTAPVHDLHCARTGLSGSYSLQLLHQVTLLLLYLVHYSDYRSVLLVFLFPSPSFFFSYPQVAAFKAKHRKLNRNPVTQRNIKFASLEPVMQECESLNFKFTGPLYVRRKVSRFLWCSSIGWLFNLPSLYLLDMRVVKLKHGDLR